MKKSLIMLSAIAAFSVTSFASDMNKEMLNQIQALKVQIEALEKKQLSKKLKSQLFNKLLLMKKELKILRKNLILFQKQQLLQKFKVVMTI